MDKAEYVFYKLAGGEENKKEYGRMSLVDNINNAHEYSQTSLKNPDRKMSFLVNRRNSNIWNTNYDINQAAKLGIIFQRQYPEEVPDLTVDPETGKNIPYDRAYGIAGEKGYNYFRYGKNLYQQDKVIQGKNR